MLSDVSDRMPRKVRMASATTTMVSLPSLIYLLGCGPSRIAFAGCSRRCSRSVMICDSFLFVMGDRIVCRMARWPSGLPFLRRMRSRIAAPAINVSTCRPGIGHLRGPFPSRSVSISRCIACSVATVVATSCGLMPDSTPRRCSWNWCTYSSRISSAASVRLNVTARPSASDACLTTRPLTTSSLTSLVMLGAVTPRKALMPLTRAAGAGGIRHDD